MTSRKGALYLLGSLVVWFAVAVLLLVGADWVGALEPTGLQRPFFLSSLFMA